MVTDDLKTGPFLSPASDNHFITFARNLVAQLKRIGKKRIAETYTSTVNSFERFRDGKDILLEEVDSELMMAYETFLSSSGICPNSISFYMRNLRAIYNRAVDKELTVQEIIDKYDTLESPYLFPIIKDDGREERKQYRYEGQRINRSLKKIGKQIGLGIPLTTYVARHGWASIAKSKNITIATISEAMGHDSENTTRIYLASLDTSVVDKANSIILKSL